MTILLHGKDIDAAEGWLIAKGINYKSYEHPGMTYESRTTTLTVPNDVAANEVIRLLIEYRSAKIVAVELK